jgi:hypothetical protein
MPWIFMYLLVAAADAAVTPAPAVQPAAPGPVASATQPAPPSPAPAAAPRPLPPPTAATPFRLGLTYLNVLSQDGELADNNISTQAIGVDLAFSSTTYVRNHLGLAHQWESAGPYSARGFRIDLISLGYPIQLFRTPNFRLDLEPILNVLRGEIMFVPDDNTFLRLSSGFGLELSATFRQWFVSIQPQIDFRYLIYSDVETQSGFARLFPLRFSLGHEF